MCLDPHTGNQYMYSIHMYMYYETKMLYQYSKSDCSSGIIGDNPAGFSYIPHDATRRFPSRYKRKSFINIREIDAEKN